MKNKLRACIFYLGGSWEDHILLVDFSCNNSYQRSIGMAPFDDLYESHYRSLVC